MYPTIELLANKTSQGKQTVLPFIDPAARIYRTKSTIKHMSLWTLQWIYDIDNTFGIRWGALKYV